MTPILKIYEFLKTSYFVSNWFLIVPKLFLRSRKLGLRLVSVILAWIKLNDRLLPFNLYV